MRWRSGEICELGSCLSYSGKIGARVELPRNNNDIYRVRSMCLPSGDLCPQPVVRFSAKGINLAGDGFFSFFSRQRTPVLGAVILASTLWDGDVLSSWPI